MQRTTRTFGMIALVALSATLLLFAAACGDGGTTSSPSPSSQMSLPSSPSPSSSSPASGVSSSPSPSASGTTGMSEQELAGAAEQAAADAAAATSTAADTMSAVAADGQVSADDVQQVKAAIDRAEQLIGTANSLLENYQDEYAVYAASTQDELQQLTEYLTDIDEELGTLAGALQEGQTSGQALVDALNETADRAGSSSEQLASQASKWAVATTTAIKSQLASAHEAVATQIADTRTGALESAAAYVKALSAAIAAGSQTTQQQLNDVYSAGANAVAGLKAQGGQLAAIATQVQSLTEKLASGELPQVRTQLAKLQGMLP